VHLLALLRIPSVAGVQSAICAAEDIHEGHDVNCR
jgi:hypothetical protein